jgi:hypothetical protein
VRKTYRDRSGEGLSFRMLLLLSVGLALWLVRDHDAFASLIITNGIGAF